MNQFGRFLLISSLLSWILADDSLVITTEEGKLRGSKLKSRNGTEFRAFLSIPYAKPPVGELRFQSPQKPDCWNGIRDATIPPPMCTQKDAFYKSVSESSIEGQEDCLYLNVFSPLNVDSSFKLPVLVYIHGGGFNLGSGYPYLPDYFMDQNVIIVNMNYRLGPFGFLSTADTIIPGNYGMKDQVAALKWVKKNIAVFGGNPELVTIFGESAGAISVHLHLYSPLSTGLFQRAISQSGTAFMLLVRSKPAIIRQKTLGLGIQVGCPTESSKILLECLRKVPADELMMAHHKFYVWDFDPSVIFGIVVEPESVKDAFICKDPSIGSPINNVPWITGMNSAEGASKVAKYLSGDGHLLKEFNKNYKRLLPLIMNFIEWFDYHEINRKTEAIKQFYFGDNEINFETIKEFINMITDSVFLHPGYEGMLRYYKNSVYFYYYDHRNSISYTDLIGNGTDLGVTHADELISLFYLPFSFSVKIVNGTDLKVSKRMIERWISFARTGNPSIGGKAWDPFDAKEVNYLHITSTRDVMKKGLLTDRLSFWRNTLPYLPLSGSSNKLQSTAMGICLSLLLSVYLIFKE